MQHRKILACIALIAVAGSAMAQNAAQVVPPDAVVWKSHPLFPGAQTATLIGDPSKPETIVQRLKFPPNFKIAPHTHSYAELGTVLSGTLGWGEGPQFDPSKGGLLKAGTVFAFKANEPHFVWTTSEETIVQLVYSGPAGIVFSNQADDPRKK